MAMKKLMIFDVPLNLVREKGNDNLGEIPAGTINFYFSACVFMIRSGLSWVVKQRWLNLDFKASLKEA